MQVIDSAKDMQREAARLRAAGRVVGFVPTMGYLHEGHLSLMRIARERSDVLVVSIFVNPTQFRPGEDFDAYPRDYERDARLLQDVGCDILFYPNAAEMYPDGYRTYVIVERLGDVLEGAARPGFFRGVATVVTKLFNIVQPHLAIFGQKDVQQAAVIQRMVQDLNLPVEIVVGPIIREQDGLAMSSRNAYLSPEERRDATVLYKALTRAREAVAAGERDVETIIASMEAMIGQAASARVDYIAVVNPQTFEPVAQIDRQVLALLAVFIGSTRLIDNMLVTPANRH